MSAGRRALRLGVGSVHLLTGGVLRTPAFRYAAAKFVATGLLLLTAFWRALIPGGLVGATWTIALSATGAMLLANLLAKWRLKPAARAYRDAFGNPLLMVLSLTGVAIPLATGLALPFIRRFVPTVATYAVSHRSLLALVTVACFVLFTSITALSYRYGSGKRRAAQVAIAPALAAVFGGTVTAWNDVAGVAHRKDGSFFISPVPAGAFTQPLASAAKIAQILPQYAIAEFSTPQQITLLPIDQVDGELHRRESQAGSEGLIVATERITDTAARSENTRLRLTPGVTGGGAGTLSMLAADAGQSLVEFQPENRLAFFATVPPVVLSLRTRFAEALRLESTPWSIELEVEMAPNPDGGDDRIEVVRMIRGGAALGLGVEKRLAILRDLVLVVPGGGSGWTVHDDPVTAAVTLSYGKPLQLPKQVSMESLLPTAIRPDQWNQLTLGLGANGERVGINLQYGPHTLISGPVGSGKTVALLQLAASALSTGHQIVLIDPTKAGLDFLKIRPFCSVWAVTLQDAQAAIEAVYEEGQRRKGLLQKYEEVKWSDLPAAVRMAENIHPTTVIIDEFMALALQEPVPKLDRDHPLVLVANERNSARAILLANVGSIARELRFSGIFLALAMQRADAGQLAGFGEVRSNLSSALQLAAPGKVPASETLRMVFPGESTAEAARVLADLDDGHSRGLAVIGAEGGSVQGFRVGYAPAREMPELLQSIGVEPAVKWIVKPTASSNPEPWRRRKVDPDVSEAPPIETVESAFTLSLDDLDREPEVLQPAPPIPNFWSK